MITALGLNDREKNQPFTDKQRLIPDFYATFVLVNHILKVVCSAGNKHWICYKGTWFF